MDDKVLRKYSPIMYTPAGTVRDARPLETGIPETALQADSIKR
jgi:hypothetical protein